MPELAGSFYFAGPMSIFVVLNLLAFATGLFCLYRVQSKGASLSKSVLMGLLFGSVFGLLMQFIYGAGHSAISTTLAWLHVVGGGYVNLLKMIVIPLVFISMIAAVVKLESKQGSLGKIAGLNISILLFTTAISALIGILVANAFGLNAETILSGFSAGLNEGINEGINEGLIEGSREAAQIEVLNSKQQRVDGLSIPQLLVSFIPVNPFADLAGLRSTSVISVVIFSMLVGIAARKVIQEVSELEAAIIKAVDVLQRIIMRLVKMIMALTPYGIAALMAKVVASSSAGDILNLLSFVVASYAAIALMFLVHGLLVSLVGMPMKDYFKRIWPVLTFAFSSRSSAATIPLNVDTQVRKLNVPPAIANLAATFGATIGQNGCAGIYPAMLAVMVAPSVGINPMDMSFILSLIGMVVISSFGIAGVGGGATFAALIVLPAMGLPVTIVALLISIEPLIDMARTALNVSGAMTAGTVSSRLLGKSKTEEVTLKSQNQNQNQTLTA